MEPVLIVLGVLVAAAVWWLTRRRKQLLQEGFPDTASEPEPDEGPPQVLRRSMLEQSRSFDPSAWDNTPDPDPDGGGGHDDWAVADEGDGPGDDLPRFFDRDYLRRQGEAPSSD